VFVNKMDRIGADFQRALSMMRDRLNANPVPIQIPVLEKDAFLGVIDLIRMKAIVWDQETQGETFELLDIPSDYREEAETARKFMLEAAAESDEELLEHYLENDDLDEKQIIKGLRIGTISGRLIPTLCGTALKNKGVQPVIDAAVDFLPSPQEAPPVSGFNPETGEIEYRSPKGKEPLCGYAFKVVMDQGRKAHYVRVYSGELESEKEVLNASRGIKERVARLFTVHANKREKVKSVPAGSIVLVVGLKDTRTGDTITAVSSPIVLESLEAKTPVISIAVEPRTRADQEKLLSTLDKMGIEDPSFAYRENEETGQMLVSGMGELHLEIVLDRLKREYGLEVVTGKPQVVYKETIMGSGLGHVRFEREIHEVAHIGEVSIEVRAAARGAGISFQYDPALSEIPKNLLEYMELGAREANLAGVIAGNEVVDVAVRFKGIGQDWHSMTGLGVKVAASQACREACEQASPVLLEPYMKLEIITPEEFMGEVIADLNSRRGKLDQVTPQGRISVINALAPLATMFGYSTALRSMTQGRAVFTMQYSHYDARP
jgi:elongation factor G